ncbi:MAG: hypothetical protein ACRBCS_12275 [Cellvibrionaceae bacterium]
MNTLTRIFLLTTFTLLASGLSFAEKTSSVEITEKSFGCVLEMTPVRGFFVDNLLGDMDMKGTLEVANSKDGGEYPPGSVVQLVPSEVMVKHDKGFNPTTNDWEFFELNVSAEGSEIGKRGFDDVINKFGGNCLDCHMKAEKKWDLVCETGHGCDPLPLTKQMVSVIQKTDPRCQGIVLTEEEKVIAQQLQMLLK